MSNQDNSPAIPFKSELDLARSGSRSATISLPATSPTNQASCGIESKPVHSVLSTDMHNTRTPPPTAPKATSTSPVAVPNLTKKARGRQVPTTKEALLRPSIAGRSYACKVENCRKVFTRSEHLKRHIRSIHTNERPFQCEEPECGKFFTRHDNLLQHRRSHRGHTTTTTAAFSGTSPSSPVNPCDIPGPFGRVYTGSTLARETRQRQQATTDVNHSIDGGATATSDPSASASASMGVLLPSPLTTVPAYSRVESFTTAEKAHQAQALAGHRPPPSHAKSSSESSLTLPPFSQNQSYHHANPHPHGRRHSLSSVSVSSGPTDFSDRTAIATDPGAPAPGTPTSTSSPTSATSTASPFAMNYDYSSSSVDGGGSGSLSPSGHHGHGGHGYPPYLAAVSCYYDERVHRSPPDFHGYHPSHHSPHPPHASHYASGHGASAAAYQQYHHQAPFVHISVPVQGEMVNGRGSYLQWRV
ncbi:hypothetical protein EIP91_007468 [Steccherinum ochraceum]|uniref:C2H2-type domain-containing protein n=1 Tax=Steccherinum ochraceum TaxID=92696 RepID=A0A4R0RII6_9APHY|nr:hypothetical protein EIP91_007468 [Steccherinum ochraceum]